MTLYNEESKKAIYKHRELHRDSYNARQRDYYHKKRLDHEWLFFHNQKCREANTRYREKKNIENPPKPRGRPRKIKIEDNRVIVNIDNIDNNDNI